MCDLKNPHFFEGQTLDESLLSFFSNIYNTYIHYIMCVFIYTYMYT